MKSIVFGITVSNSLHLLSDFPQLFSRISDPTAMVLFGAGLILLGVWGRKRLSK
jgi:hypothetical protein